MTVLEKELIERMRAGENFHNIVDKDDRFDDVEYDYDHENIKYFGDDMFGDFYIVIGDERIFVGRGKIN
jgi:hypothetical protein